MLEKRIKSNADKLTKTLKACELLDETELSHLYELHDLYNTAFDICGDITSDALFIKDEAYINRKNKYAEIILSETGTVAEREAKAELAVKEYRDSEKIGNYALDKFKSKQKSIDHKLYDIKAKRAAMERELHRN